MFSPWRTLKETRLVLTLLCVRCGRLLRRARKSKNPRVLTDNRVMYALERRLLEYLSSREAWGFDRSTPPLLRAAFETLQDTLAWLMEVSPEEEARFFNKKLNHLEKLAKVPELRSYPLRCYYETTNRCNLRCPMCGQSFVKGQRTDMPREALRRLSPVFKWFDEIHIFGYGESLLYPHLAELIEAVPPHVSSRLVTNGILLTPENNRMLVEKGLTSLFISIDAVNPETYESIRGVDKLEEVKDNIRDLVSYKKSLNTNLPELSFAYVAMKRNIAQLSDFIRMAKSLGVENVVADYLTVYSDALREESLFYDQELSDRYIEEAIEVAKETGVHFIPPTKFSERQEGRNQRRPCYEPWEFIYFRSDGRVQTCCTNPEPLGIWDKEDFHEVWNSPEFQELRKTIGTPDEPSWCTNCVHVLFRDICKETSHIRILKENGQPRDT